ncbi:hypothetical protein AGMMS49959_16940 [Planctomycetales bacterium]|nr:hypothetical protein AGMMS49959_16940 [Planctomycetales bacterium]
MAKKTSLILIFIISTLIGFGQRYSELTVELGGGLSSINYKMDYGKQSAGFGELKIYGFVVIFEIV